MLVDPGGSWKGAEALHGAIRKVTDQSVRYVINTGGQDHRWLGNGYWRKHGATIIASEAAVADHKDRGSMQLTMLGQLLKDSLSGTKPAYADVTFESAHISSALVVWTSKFGYEGPAHTPGDSFVWVPSKKTVFAGDIVYVERILGVGSQSNSKSWIAAFDAMAAIKPQHVVPGHGGPTNLKRASAETRAYLVNLRSSDRKAPRSGRRHDRVGESRPIELQAPRAVRRSRTAQRPSRLRRDGIRVNDSRA